MKFILTLLFAGALLGPVQADELRELIPSSQDVGGHTQAQWSQSWWQWAASFQGDANPVADATGEYCHLKQSGPVWFLAGTYGTRRTIRSCTVPRGKYLFFPIINYVVFPRAGIEATTCESVTQSAQRMTDNPMSLFVDLSGSRVVNLESHRLATPGCFDLWARVHGGAKLFPAAANGYYVMLKPLKPGRYELNFGGALPGMVQAVSYSLTVR